MPKSPPLLALPICITGASAGIGRATAIRCADAGMPIIAGARREDRLNELIATIEGRGGRAIAMVCDVNDPEHSQRMVERCVDAYGSVHAVLANAGYGHEARVHELTDQELREIFETNFFGTMHIIRAALPHMLASRRGHILITSSSIGVLPIPRHGHYCATKAAQHHIGRAMAHELRPLGVRVSTIHPVGTRTEFFERARERAAPGSSTTDGSTAMGAKTPALFMQDPETVANAIVKCLRRPRAEVWPGGTWWVRVLMAGLIAFPPAADAVFRFRP